MLHVGKFYPPVPGGIERVVESLCQVERGRLDNRVLAFNTSARTIHEVVDGIPVTRVGTVGTCRIGRRSRRRSPLHLRRAEADVMILHEPNPWALLSFAVVRPRMPLAIWFHSEVVRPRLQYDALLRADRAARVPAARAGSSCRRRRSRRTPRRSRRISDRVTVIPFGIDPRIAGAPRRVRQRAADISAKRASAVLFAGRHVPYKGVDVLLRARAAALDVRSDRRRRSDAARVGAARARLRTRAVASRSPGKCPTTSSARILRACACLVLPSVTRAEAFGYVQLEAMACGKPVISTRRPSGVPWVNQHEQTGLVVPAGDAARLRGAIDATDRGCGARAPARRAAGGARVEEEFTLGACASGCVALYAECARCCRRGRPHAEAARSTQRLFGRGPGSASAPLWVLFAAAIKFEDGGPVFFSAGARRAAAAGVFDALKFRSMRPDAEAGTGAVQATENDPRVTRIGRFMRATAMDELPQLWNIFRGDMSFVGPRALRPGEIEAATAARLDAARNVPGLSRASACAPA